MLLILVAVDKPYRDSQGHEGLTEADKLQLNSVLLDYSANN